MLAAPTLAAQDTADANADPNLVLQQQRAAAAAPTSTNQPAPIPAPPPLPGTRTAAASTPFAAPTGPAADTKPATQPASPTSGPLTIPPPPPAGYGQAYGPPQGGPSAGAVAGSPIAAPTGPASDTNSSTQPPAATAGTTMPATGGTPPGVPSSVAIGSTVLPQDSSRLTGLKAATDTAASNLTGDPRLANLRSLVDSSASGLAGVDRTKLAQDMFDTFAKSTDPQYLADLRAAKQAGAVGGQIGNGQLRTRFGDLAATRAAALDTAKRSFMDNALQGSIQDQFNKTSALSGLEGQTHGENASDVGTAAGLEGQVAGQEYGARNELRGERGYQGSLEDQAFQRALDKYRLNQDAQAQQFGQGVTLAELGGAGNPAAYYGAAGAANPVDMGSLAGFGYQMGSGPAPSSGTPTVSSSPPAPPPLPSGGVPGVSAIPSASIPTTLPYAPPAPPLGYDMSQYR